MSKASKLIDLVEQADPSSKPPKKWWDEMYKEIKDANPDYSDEQISATIGDIWYHELDDKKRSELRAKEGKKLK